MLFIYRFEHSPLGMPSKLVEPRDPLGGQYRSVVLSRVKGGTAWLAPLRSSCPIPCDTPYGAMMVRLIEAVKSMPHALSTHSPRQSIGVSMGIVVAPLFSRVKIQ